MRLLRTFQPVLALSLLATAVQAGDLPPDELVSALREGGLVIYLRHASTEADYADQVSAIMGDCSTQRVLSATGWAEARAIGAALRDADIPLGTVLSSEYCRAWQTAELVAGRHETTDALNFEPAEDYSDAQMAAMRDRVAPLLGEVPERGNTLLVGHDDPFEAATGIYPEPMGVAYILRPDGSGGFEVLGRIAPTDWPGV